MPMPRHPLRIGAHTITPSKATKYLGIFLDQELHFKQAAHTLGKGTDWVMQFRCLSKPSLGLPPRHVRWLYYSIVVPHMMYAANVWCTPIHKTVRATLSASPPFGTFPLFFTLFGFGFAPEWLWSEPSLAPSPLSSCSEALRSLPLPSFQCSHRAVHICAHLGAV
jgi:hypothetical protein